MSNMSPVQDNSRPSDDHQSAAHGMSSAALARRRLLLRGTTASATALAALTPIGALATSQSTVYTCIGTSGKEGLCTLSGVQSAAHSFGPDTERVPAGGKSPGWWGQSNKTGEPKRPWPVDWREKVSTVLTMAPSNLRSLTLFELMSKSTYASTSERHWLCAYLNAKAGEQGALLPYGFPYTSSEVLGFYLTGNQNAYSFFTTYLENL
ncbi:hypothetical protein [Pseudorhodoferax soli]|nr:hypothetical protein [Pseudorhodoferax soli]